MISPSYINVYRTKLGYYVMGQIHMSRASADRGATLVSLLRVYMLVVRRTK